MARQAGWGRCLGVAWLMTVAADVPILGQELPGNGAGTRVRTCDTRAAVLLRQGREGSPTFAAMLQRLEGSDLILYVETRPLTLPGQVQLVAASPTCRYLRVSVHTPGLDTEQTAWLAHELRHAVEIADATDVRDQASLRRLYERIGAVGRYRAQFAETVEAQEIRTTVLHELRCTPARTARRQ